MIVTERMETIIDRFFCVNYAENRIQSLKFTHAYNNACVELLKLQRHTEQLTTRTDSTRFANSCKRYADNYESSPK